MAVLLEGLVIYELKLAANGRVVTWEGESGEDAARRFVDTHRDWPDVAVIAWRQPRHGLFVGLREIVQ